MALPCPTTIGEIVWYVLLGVVGFAFAEPRWAFHKMISKQEEFLEKQAAPARTDVAPLIAWAKAGL